MPVQKQRDGLIDAIKAFAIICVVFAHCIEFGSGQRVLSKELFFDDPLFEFICSFHMPLFMLVSGYLFAFSIRKGSYASLLMKKVNTLIIPLFSWAVVEVGIYIVSCFLNKSGWPGFKELALELLYRFLHHQWFLWAVFWCTLIVLTNKYLFKDSLVIYLAVFILTFFLPDGNNIALYSFMYPYFVIGYLINREDTGKRESSLGQKWLLPVLLALFIALFLLYNRDSYVYTSGYSLIGEKSGILRQLGIDLYRLVIGLVGSVVIVLSIKALYCHFPIGVKNVMSNIGMNTLGIYILSNLVFNDHFLRTFSIRLDGIHYGFVVLETIVVIVVTLLLTWIIKKIVFLNEILLGGRR